MTTNIDGSMPAWHQGVGYLNLAINQRDISNSERKNLFLDAVKAYDIHFETEIHKVSKPPYSVLNRIISTHFKEICILEANGSIMILENILRDFQMVNNPDIDPTIGNIFRAVKLQIEAKIGDYSSEIV